MALKSPAEYVRSLCDRRVTFWGGERIDDVAARPRFKTSIANARGLHR